MCYVIPNLRYDISACTKNDKAPSFDEALFLQIMKPKI